MATLDGTRRSFHIVSLGCTKNTVDSEAMAQLLLAAGHERAPDAASADLVVVNTCGFIEAAKQEMRIGDCRARAAPAVADRAW